MPLVVDGVPGVPFAAIGGPAERCSEAGSIGPRIAEGSIFGRGEFVMSCVGVWGG